MEASDWKKKKKAELEFLQNFKRKISKWNLNKPSLAQKKGEAAHRIKMAFPFHLSESNFEPIKKTLHYEGLKIRFGYQRINVNHDDPYKDHPYQSLDLDQKMVSAHLSYTTTGQSAISAALFCAKDIYRKHTIQSPTEIYYETRDFLKYFGFKFATIQSRIRNKTKTKPVVFIDSSGNMPNLKILKIDACIAIIDTTCWSLCGPETPQLVSYFLKRKVDVILVRSHIKIDCLATEWNRLGSLMFITAKGSRERQLRLFRNSLNHHGSYWGVRAEIPQIYPFLKSKAFHKINESWVKRLRASGLAFEKAILQDDLPPDIKYRTFDHHLFSWFIFRHSRKKTSIDASKRLLKLLQSAKIPAATIAGFPWDFLAICHFDTKLKFNGRNEGVVVVRLSIPDCDDSTLIKTIKVVQAWVNSPMPNPDLTPKRV